MESGRVEVCVCSIDWLALSLGFLDWAGSRGELINRLKICGLDGFPSSHTAGHEDSGIYAVLRFSIASPNLSLPD